jgi:hypothetical protein
MTESACTTKPEQFGDDAPKRRRTVLIGAAISLTGVFERPRSDQSARSAQRDADRIGCWLMKGRQ